MTFLLQLLLLLWLYFIDWITLQEGFTGSVLFSFLLAWLHIIYYYHIDTEFEIILKVVSWKISNKFISCGCTQLRTMVGREGQKILKFCIL